MNSSREPLQEIVLLIGALDHEGVLSTIKAAEGTYKIKRLSSKPENWQSMVELFDEFKVLCAVVKFNESTYKQILSEEYNSVSNALLEKIREVPHLVFIHEYLFTGEETQQMEDLLDVDFEHPLFEHLDDEVRIWVNRFLDECGIKVLTYKTNAQLTVLASNFIADTADGLIFRLYVPSKRIWANQTEKLIQLFQEYLAQIGQRSVRLDQRKTASGTVFEFFDKEKSQYDANSENYLAIEFEQFAKILDFSLTEPNKAEAILSSKQVDRNEVVRIVARYAKEARRLQTDLKHEREQKVLSIRQRMESELIDELPTNVEPHYLEGLINAAVPTISGLGSAFGGAAVPLQLSAGDGGALTVNFQPQFIKAFNSVVAQEINGNVQLTQQDMRIMELIHEHAPDREPELSSAVRELADESAPNSDRLLSKQKLKVFLSSIGGAVQEMAIDVLKSYIEEKIGL